MTTMKLETPFLTVDEVCELLGVQKPTLYRYMNDLGMPFHQVVRRGKRYFVASEIEEWVMSRCINPTPASTADEGVA